MCRTVARVILWTFVLSGPCCAAETPHDQVVSEFIHQMATMQEMLETSSRELATSDNKVMDSIRVSTAIKLELGRNIRVLKSMTLASPYDTLLPTVIGLYEQKIGLHDDLIYIATEFASAGGVPKPGIDYGKLSAAMPKIAATIEYADKTLFKMTAMFCFLLVDDNADSEGKLSRLNITKARRREMIKQIDDSFGHRLAEKNPKYATAAGKLIKSFLVSGRKSADDL